MQNIWNRIDGNSTTGAQADLNFLNNRGTGLLRNTSYFSGLD
jgi:hypothetical protein